MAYALRLIEHRLAGGALTATLPALNRVLYADGGDVTIIVDGHATLLAAGAAWHGARACTVRAGAGGARLLRFELYAGSAAAPGDGTLLLDHPIALDAGAAWLMRCDRVDFAPGGEAPPHRHRGGGIRCLLRGRIDVKVGDEPPRRILPGGAWFESGREPVHALAAPDAETSFVRVTVQPAEIRGQSSILYVDPADAARKPRTYTVFVDEPIAL